MSSWSFFVVLARSLYCPLAVRLIARKVQMNPDAIMPKHFGNSSAPYKILVLGDGLTAGWWNHGHGPFLPYGRYLQRTLGTDVQVIVDGIH